MITLVMNGRAPSLNRLEDFACDVINHFFPKDLKRDVYIQVDFVKNLEDNDAGCCVNFGKSEGTQHINISLSRRCIVDDENFAYSAKEIANTLAHELVHAKQNIRGEMSNKMLTACMKPKMTESYYRSLPWEIEAFDLQDFLVDLYW